MDESDVRDRGAAISAAQGRDDQRAEQVGRRDAYPTGRASRPEPDGLGPAWAQRAVSRRDALRTAAWVAAGMGAALAAPRLEAAVGASAPGVRFWFTAISDRTLRITAAFGAAAGQDGEGVTPPAIVPDDSLLPAYRHLPPQAATAAGGNVACGGWRIAIRPEGGVTVQPPGSPAAPMQLTFDAARGGFRFPLGGGPVFGLGEGAQQFPATSKRPEREGASVAGRRSPTAATPGSPKRSGALWGGTNGSVQGRAAGPLDRRGGVYEMRHGEFGPELAHEGARVEIPWLIGDGFALLLHQPQGIFDLTGGECRFQPRPPHWPFEQRRREHAAGSAARPMASGEEHGEPPESQPPNSPRFAFLHAPPRPLPGAGTLDFFLVLGGSPAERLAEYCRLTGLPQMPPLWAFGYQQSHRTIWSRDVVMGVARTFRQKRLPCDALIYLGTGFCPSGWNTGNGSFDFNPRTFPDPRAMIAELHREHFKVVLHVVPFADKLVGKASDPCPVDRLSDEQAGCYWDDHRRDFALGVDGWWADEGDRLDAASRLNRIRMYWQGEQLSRPNRRPYALHRNGYTGMQRFAPLLWSGDTLSQWATLRTQIANGLNTGLSGVPYWGTDIGGFVPTPEFTAELFVRWFQFGAFCPVFRGHGRAWMLRLPWGWDMGTTGPPETGGYRGAALPPPSALHNTAVEPICRRYLELRYRLLPYIQSAVYQTHRTGLPMMRALWLHYPEDPRAATCANQYLWGRDILVAPVAQPGAKERQVYLPGGIWHDFWTGEVVTGGREIRRAVDLATLPLYVRAGATIPTGPVKQYAGEPVPGPIELTVYPGAAGEGFFYDDDGETFDYRRGDWMGVRLHWAEPEHQLHLSLAPGSRVRPGPGEPAGERRFRVRLAPHGAAQDVIFRGEATAIRL
ncbi:MAG: TIM-barrel domain-containing protein [Terriglobales bacterium]